jgi:hypothetical protein
MAVEIAGGASFKAGIPKSLFKAPIELQPVANVPSAAVFPVWDVTREGDRFLISTPVEQSAAAQFTVVLNWTELLNK